MRTRRLPSTRQIYAPASHEPSQSAHKPLPHTGSLNLRMSLPHIGLLNQLTCNCLTWARLVCCYVSASQEPSQSADVSPPHVSPLNFVAMSLPHKSRLNLLCYVSTVPYLSPRLELQYMEACYSTGTVTRFCLNMSD